LAGLHCERRIVAKTRHQARAVGRAISQPFRQPGLDVFGSSARFPKKDCAASIRFAKSQVAEDQVFLHGRRQRGTVDGQKWLFRRDPLMVNGSSQGALAGAGFADQSYRHAMQTGQARLFEQALAKWVFAGQVL